MLNDFEVGQEVILNTRQETYVAIFLPEKKYKIKSMKIQYLIEDEDGNMVYIDENELIEANEK